MAQFEKVTEEKAQELRKQFQQAVEDATKGFALFGREQGALANRFLNLGLGPVESKDADLKTR